MPLGLLQLSLAGFLISSHHLSGGFSTQAGIPSFWQLTEGWLSSAPKVGVGGGVGLAGLV